MLAAHTMQAHRPTRALSLHATPVPVRHGLALAALSLLFAACSDDNRIAESTLPSSMFGTVADAFGAPIAGARIELMQSGPSASGVLFALTNSVGRWVFVDVTPGDFRLQIKAGAFATERRTVAIAGDEALEFHTNLIRLPAETIVVPGQALTLFERGLLMRGQPGILGPATARVGLGIALVGDPRFEATAPQFGPIAGVDGAMSSLVLVAHGDVQAFDILNGQQLLVAGGGRLEFTVPLATPLPPGALADFEVFMVNRDEDFLVPVDVLRTGGSNVMFQLPELGRFVIGMRAPLAQLEVRLGYGPEVVTGSTVRFLGIGWKAEGITGRNGAVRLPVVASAPCLVEQLDVGLNWRLLGAVQTPFVQGVGSVTYTDGDGVTR